MRRLLFVCIILGLAAVLLSSCSILDLDGSNARQAAQAEQAAAAYRLQEQQAAAEREALRYAQLQDAQQALEAARLAYLNQAAQAQRDFYALLVTSQAMTAQQAAQRMLDERKAPGFFDEIPTWLLVLAGGALGGLAVAVVVTVLDNRR